MTRRFAGPVLAAALAVAMLAVPASAHPPGPLEQQGRDRAAERAPDGRASEVIDRIRGGERPGPAGAVDVTILHDTHFHGDFGAEDGPNIARYMALVADLKEQNPGALFLGNGDDLAPSVLAGVFRGAHMIEALNASPLDVNTFGNHEFDFGPDNLRERIAESEFTWVTANVRDTTSGDAFGADLGVERYTLREVDGVTVGITGVGPQNMGTVTTLGPDTEQIPAVEAMTELVPEMRAAGADIIVVTSHLCGPDARDLAANVDGIDAIVGDHCASVLEQPEVINDTIVSFAGDEFDLLGELTLRVKNGRVVSHAYTLHEVTGDLPVHPEIQQIVERWEAELDTALGETIGFRTNDWDVRTVQVRSTETGFANYIVDAMRTAVGADVALTNGGGIRSDTVYPGGEDVTRRDVLAVLPFGNKVVMTEVTGTTLLAALEHGVSAGTPQGRFPQVSGMTYTWDPAASAGSRIVEATVAGEPLDPSATYRLATNDFLLGGGDGYGMLAEGTVIIGSEGARLMVEVVSEQVIADGSVTVSTDGRIARVS
jgi:5'-nucleotidase / UDP-sugar diphosphatase